jgi:hypothetical protein
MIQNGGKTPQANPGRSSFLRGAAGIGRSLGMRLVIVMNRRLIHQRSSTNNDPDRNSPKIDGQSRDRLSWQPKLWH